MAVDTALKRFSIMRLAQTGTPHTPDTSGITAGERQALLGLYASGEGGGGVGGGGVSTQQPRIEMSIGIGL